MLSTVLYLSFIQYFSGSGALLKPNFGFKQNFEIVLKQRTFFNQLRPFGKTSFFLRQYFKSFLYQLLEREGSDLKHRKRKVSRTFIFEHFKYHKEYVKSYEVTAISPSSISNNADNKLKIVL